MNSQVEIDHLTLNLDASLTRDSDPVEATKMTSKDNQPDKKVRKC